MRLKYLDDQGRIQIVQIKQAFQDDENLYFVPVDDFRIIKVAKVSKDQRKNMLEFLFENGKLNICLLKNDVSFVSAEL